MDSKHWSFFVMQRFLQDSISQIHKTPQQEVQVTDITVHKGNQSQKSVGAGDENQNVLFINIGTSCLSPYFLSVNPTTLPSLTGLPSQIQKAFPNQTFTQVTRFWQRSASFFLPEEQNKNKSTPTTLHEFSLRPPLVSTQQPGQRHLQQQAGQQKKSVKCVLKVARTS